MAQPAKKAKTAASDDSAGILLTFGESMIRFAPLDETTPATATRAEPQPFLRSVGGDELNVAVALSKLGERTRWISVVPQGPMGDVVVESGTANGVTVAEPRPATGDVGTFTVLPEAKTVLSAANDALRADRRLDWPTPRQLDGAAGCATVAGRRRRGRAGRGDHRAAAAACVARPQLPRQPARWQSCDGRQPRIEFEAVSSRSTAERPVFLPESAG